VGVSEGPHTPAPSALEPEARSSRTLLGVLLGVLVIAVLLALLLLITRNNDENAADAADALPTPLPVPTTTPAPVQPTATAPTPTPEPTPVPEGFEACDVARSPLVSATYIVDTVETPLNQRLEPSVDGEQVGTFAPGQTGLVFNGECLVNLADGFVWWQINNGTQEVWVASDFVTAT